MARPNVTAFIYGKKGELLSVGKNSYVKTHPLQAKIAAQVGEPNKIYLHAEIHAITRLRREDVPKRILVVRVDSQGRPALAKPCRVCQEALRQVGIKEIKHT
jgi:deoxycytidylate deaminase